jgi:hypothetical protein
MADPSMAEPSESRWLSLSHAASNASSARDVDFALLAKLVAAEPLPAALDAAHVAHHCCVLHLRVADDPSHDHAKVLDLT